MTHKGQLVPCQLCPAGEMQRVWDVCLGDALLEVWLHHGTGAQRFWIPDTLEHSHISAGQSPALC